MIVNTYRDFKEVIKSEKFDPDDRKYVERIAYDMDDATACGAINQLCVYLEAYYGKKPIILLDEYDTPMQEAWLAGNWEETVEFFRSFFNATFKTNPHLLRGMITGITRISKESIFSDLNNPDVVSVTSDKYAEYFGFTEGEVFQVLENMGLGEKKQEVKKWYNGFTFGKYTDIYNPWSITSFISNQGEYGMYWADTSSNGLISSLIQSSSPDTKKVMEALLQGKSFQTELEEQIVFEQIGKKPDAIWSLMLATGYLKVERIQEKDRFQKKNYTLRLTNMEVEGMFADMVEGWFAVQDGAYNNFVKAMLLDDVEAMNEFMNKIALQSFSSFDTGKSASKQDDPERFYHGFVLGLMVGLEGRFVITSNKESGFGRYDIMLKPTDRQRDLAYIIEFKVRKPKREKNLEATVANALAQIEEKQYSAQLTAEGFQPERIRKFGFAFEGRQCLIGGGDFR